MEKMTAEKYRELFRLRAQGKLDDMECTKRLYEILKDLYFDGVKILDSACGLGHYFRKIRELGNIDYLGIDVDPKAIEMAKEVWRDASNAEFEVQDVHHLYLEDNSFDIVYCYNLLLHLRDYKEPLKELFRVSKRYIIVRSLFDEKESINSFDVASDYLEVYPSGKVQYNTYARNEVANFLKTLDPCNFKFIEDNVSISQETIERQSNDLNVNGSEFARGGEGQKEHFKGLLLNYEILFIEKG